MPIPNWTKGMTPGEVYYEPDKSKPICRKTIRNTKDTITVRCDDTFVGKTLILNGGSGYGKQYVIRKQKWYKRLFNYLTNLFK